MQRCTLKNSPAPGLNSVYPQEPLTNKKAHLILKNPTILFVLWLLWFQVTGTALAMAERPTAFIHASLVPMTTEMVLPDQTVVVKGKRITRIGPSGQTAIPENARVVDCKNAFLMPGLADMHMHLRYNWLSDAWPVSPLKLYIANGVTTIRCFGPRGKTGRYGLKWRKAIDDGELVGPAILTCGPQLRGHFKKQPEDLVIRQKYRGFDFVKIYSYVTRAEYDEIMRMAKRLNFYTAGHIPFQVGLDGVLAAGMDEIAHIEELLWEFSDLDRSRYFESEGEWMTHAIRITFDRLSPFIDLNPQDREQKLKPMISTVVNKLRYRPVPFSTTLVVDDVIVQKLFHPERFSKKPENRFLPKAYLERLQEGREKHQVQFKGGEAFAPLKYQLDRALVKALKKSGNPLLLSTDAGTGGMGIVPGFSVHDELRILAECGFTPYEAIAAGTAVASRIVMRMIGKDEFGTIVPGKRADLVLLQKNPLEDVTNTRKIIGVMAAGRWYDAKTLAEMLEPGGLK